MTDETSRDDVGTPADRELVITRLLPAPRQLVWDAWTDCAHLPHWWGPHGMTTPVCEIDLRPGGIFKTVMRDPAGVEYPNQGVFVEVDPPSRLVFSEEVDEAGQPSGWAYATITFADEDGQTRLTARWLHKTVADREKHEQMGFDQGWGEMFDRLAAHLEPLTAAR